MTAVDWLIKELNLEGYDYTIEQAKQMEKWQICDAWKDGHNNGWNTRENDYNPNPCYRKSNGEEWYNYTFNYKYGQLKSK